MAEQFYDDWVKDKTKEEMVKEISELRRNIKLKHQALQRQLTDNSELLEKQWKPVAEPLIKLLEEQEESKSEKEKLNNRKRKPNENFEEATPVKHFIRTPDQGVKRKQKINLPTREDYESDYEYDDGNEGLPPSKRPAIPSTTFDTNEMEYENQGDEEQSIEEMQHEPVVYETTSTGEALLKTPKGRHYAKEFVERIFTGNIAKDYFLKLIRGGKPIDHNYGVRVEGNDWMIGDKKIEIDENDIIVNGVRYLGTRGLYELIFMNSPNQYIYTEEDLKSYAGILKDTNVYRVNYSALGRRRSNRGHKYLHIIAPILNEWDNGASGSGVLKTTPKSRKNKLTQQDYVIKANPMTTYPDLLAPQSDLHGVTLGNGNPEYIYFDDPNELVDRLRLLYGSQEAGNNGHKNEINSIIEELLELENNGVINV